MWEEDGDSLMRRIDPKHLVHRSQRSDVKSTDSSGHSNMADPAHLSGVTGRHRAAAPRVGRLPRGRRLLQAARQRLAAVQGGAVRIHLRSQTSDPDWLLRLICCKPPEDPSQQESVHWFTPGRITLELS